MRLLLALTISSANGERFGSLSKLMTILPVVAIIDLEMGLIMLLFLRN